MRRVKLALLALAVGVAGGVASGCVYRPAGANGYFDLTPLRKSAGNYKVEDPKSSAVYLLNFCGPLVEDPDFKRYSCLPSSSACLGQVGGSGVGKSLGSASASDIRQLAFILKYMLYGGEVCPANPSTKIKTMILLQCQDTGPDEELTFLRAENCEHVFRMKTSAACLRGDSAGRENPTPSVNCKTQDSTGNVYDLSPLVREETDWFVTTAETDYQWYLNVCHDVNDVPSNKCSVGSSACVTKRSNSTFWRSIGRTAETQLEYDDRKGLTLTMDGGELCPDQTKSKTVIDFICDGSSMEVGKPIYMDDNPEDCVHQFAWRTYHACPGRSIQAFDCELRDTTMEVNVGPLRKTKEGENWEIHHNEYSFLLNVCGPLQPSRMASACPPGSAACRVKETSMKLEATSLGTSQRLTNENGVLQLLIEGGDFCGESSRRQASVRMLCNPNVGTGIPKVVEDVGCMTRMEWETTYVCPKQGMSGGKVFGWTAFSLVAAYFFGGALYKRVRFGLRGARQIPNFDTWRSLYERILGRRTREYNIVL